MEHSTINPLSSSAVASASTSDVEVVPPTDPCDPGQNDSHPTLVVIFGWLGAKMATLRKYADCCQKMYPNSTQLIVPADTLRYWKPQSARELSVLPAVQQLEGLLLFADGEQVRPSRILIHAFSNAGSMSLVDVALSLRKRGLIAPAAGTTCAIIFDSTPAPLSLSLVTRAFSAALRSPIQKFLVALGMTVVYVLTFVYRAAFGVSEPIGVAMEHLNDPGLLPWTSVRTPRMYLYSDADEIVGARCVEEHAARARMAGFAVHMVNFGKSHHVSHARDYPEKYWQAVRSFWQGSGAGMGC